jgi:hypothetical protein
MEPAVRAWSPVPGHLFALVACALLRLRLGQDHYIVNWHTNAFGLDPALTYRICVKVNDVGLGFVDVDIAALGAELRVGTEGYVPLLDGRTLPITFRIEPGALDEPPVTAGPASGAKWRLSWGVLSVPRQPPWSG